MPASFSIPYAPGLLNIVFVTSPPAVICVGDTQPVTFMVVENGAPIIPTGVQVHPHLVPPGLTAESNGLIQVVAYTATTKGAETLQITASGPDGSTGTNAVAFLVQRCPYTIEITTVEGLNPPGDALQMSGQSLYNGSGSFAYAAGPAGLPTGSSVSGTGSGGVYLTIEAGDQGGNCHLNPPIMGQGPFTISGSIENLGPAVASISLLHLDLDVPPIPDTSAAIECDVSGAQASIPLSTFLPNFHWDPTPLNLKDLLLPASGGSLSYPVSRANGLFLGTVTITVTRSSQPRRTACVRSLFSASWRALPWPATCRNFPADHSAAPMAPERSTWRTRPPG